MSSNGVRAARATVGGDHTARRALSGNRGLLRREALRNIEESRTFFSLPSGDAAISSLSVSHAGARRLLQTKGEFAAKQDAVTCCGRAVAEHRLERRSIFATALCTHQWPHQGAYILTKAGCS